jgi:alpha-soluble NSF attachment protein
VEYQKSADYYKGEEQRSSANKCLLKVALLAADLEQYQQAMHTFEEVAIYETENHMLRHSATTHFFQVILQINT